MSDFAAEIRASIATVTGSDNPETLGLCTDTGLARGHAEQLAAAIADHDLCDDHALEAYDLCRSLVSFGRAF